MSSKGGAKFRNSISRSFSNTREALGKSVKRVKSSFKDQLSKLGGDQMWLTKEKLRQKKQFKLLHQKTFAEGNAAALKNGSQDKIDHRWTDDSPVNRDLFTKNIADCVTKQIIRFDTANNAQRSKLVFVKKGKAVLIFQMSFFNDADNDENETITWRDFKKNVFYAYVKGLQSSIDKVMAEMAAAKKLARAFRELSQELPDGQDATHNLLKLRLEAHNAFPPSDPFWQLSCFDKDNADSSTTIDQFTNKYGNKKSVQELQAIYAELVEENRSSVHSKYLNLTQNTKKQIVDTDSKDEKSEKDEQSEKSKKNNADSEKDDDDDEDGEDDDEEDDDDEDDDDDDDSDKEVSGRSRNASRLGMRSTLDDEKSKNRTVSSSSSSKQLLKVPSSNDLSKLSVDLSSRSLSDNLTVEMSVVRNEKEVSVPKKPLPPLVGFPRDLLYKLNTQSLPKLSRAVVRKLHSILKAKQEASSIEAAKMLFHNNDILFAKELKQIEILLEQERQKHAIELKRTKKVEDKDVLVAELKKAQDDLVEQEKTVRAQYLFLQNAFRGNSRNELKKLRKLVADAAVTESGEYKLMTAEAFKVQVSSVTKFYSSRSTAEHDLPLALDYSSELHEPFAQDNSDHGFFYAVVLMKEWQEFHNVKLTDRLSIDFLKQAVAEYNPSAGDHVSLVDALEVVRTTGVAIDQVYDNWKARAGREGDKSKARIKTHASMFMIDSYYKVKDLTNLKSALYKYGPLLITVPVYNAKDTFTWRNNGNKSDLPLGYHTMLLIGYDDTSSTLLLRNSLGKSWGRLGNTTMSYSEVFQSSHIQVIVTVDGTSRVSKDPQLVSPLNTSTFGTVSRNPATESLQNKLASLSLQLQQLA